MGRVWKIGPEEWQATLEAVAGRLSLSALAKRCGVNASTAYRWVERAKRGEQPYLRREAVVFEAVEGPVRDDLPVERPLTHIKPSNSSGGDCGPVGGIVGAGSAEGSLGAPVSPMDVEASLAVLRSIRDASEDVPAETRARAAIALLNHAPKAEDAAWSPPCDAEGWAGVLVELVREEPPEVRGLVRLMLEG